MAETWPPALPQCLQDDGFSQSAQPNTIRTKIEAGIDKLRRRYTSPIVSVKGNMIMSFAQYSELESFYNVTLQGGIQRFNFNDPATGTPYEYRFVSPPTYVGFGPIHYAVSLDWERF